jgi:uncharacterized protein (DUF1697 family)
MSMHVALLRGINLGPNNKMPMKALGALFENAGCTDVRTYIQSGNVVFRSKDAARVCAAIERACKKQFGFSVPIVVRTAKEIAAVVKNNPFVQKGADTNALHVGFLADEPAASKVSSLDKDRSPPDAFAVNGREIYLKLPNGVARSKLTNAYFDSKLDTVTTIRNWRTVLTLMEMCRD